MAVKRKPKSFFLAPHAPRVVEGGARWWEERRFSAKIWSAGFKSSL